MRYARIVLIGVVTMLIVAPASAHAATPVNTTPDGLGVSPAIINLQATIHEEQLKFDNTITNDSNNAVRITARAVDFTMTGVSGDVLFSETSQSAYGLASQMSVSEPNFVIPPHQTKTVTVTIRETNTLKAGGHYGAVLYKVTDPTPTSKTGSQSRVGIRKTVASLVFVTTAGKGTYQLQLLPIDNPIALFHLPNSYNLTFKNTGNTQVIPQGYVQVSGPLGTLYSRGTINTGSALVLPGTSRLLQTPVTRITHAWLPGRYTVKAYYRYAGSNTYQVQTTHFWYINFGSIICILILFMIMRSWWKRHGARVKKRILSTIHRTKS